MFLTFIALCYITQQEQLFTLLPVADTMVKNKLYFSNTSLLLQLQKQQKGRSHSTHPIQTLNNETFLLLKLKFIQSGKILALIFIHSLYFDIGH